MKALLMTIVVGMLMLLSHAYAQGQKIKIDIPKGVHTTAFYTSLLQISLDPSDYKSLLPSDITRYVCFMSDVEQHNKNCEVWHNYKKEQDHKMNIHFIVNPQSQIWDCKQVFTHCVN